MARGPRLSPEDEILWFRVAETVAPLKSKRKKPVLQSDETASATEAAAAKKPAAKPKVARSREPLRPANPSIALRRKTPPQLEPGRLVDIDRRNAERLRKGQLELEAKLDLHGYRQFEAEDALARFLAASQAAGKRCVLVITGKGRLGSEDGILRQRLGDWLNAEPNRGRVVAFARAQPKHGGGGAFYILLKRLRG